jgi:hypothetical protein
LTFPNLKARYRRINPKSKVDSVVFMAQQGDDVLYIIRWFKSVGKYYLAKTRWNRASKQFVVDMSKGDYEAFSKNLRYLKSLVPTEGTF